MIDYWQSAVVSLINRIVLIAWWKIGVDGWWTAQRRRSNSQFLYAKVTWIDCNYKRNAFISFFITKVLTLWFSFYTNWLQLIEDDQGNDGTVTDVVPFIRYVRWFCWLSSHLFSLIVKLKRNCNSLIFLFWMFSLGKSSCWSSVGNRHVKFNRDLWSCNTTIKIICYCWWSVFFLNFQYAAYPLLLWWMYEYFGDINILTKHYQSLKLYHQYIIQRVSNSGLKNM